MYTKGDDMNFELKPRHYDVMRKIDSGADLNGLEKNAIPSLIRAGLLDKDAKLTGKGIVALRGSLNGASVNGHNDSPVLVQLAPVETESNDPETALRIALEMRGIAWKAVKSYVIENTGMGEIFICMVEDMDAVVGRLTESGL